MAFTWALPFDLSLRFALPRDQMASVLEAVSWVLPMPYAYDALERVTVNG